MEFYRGIAAIAVLFFHLSGIFNEQFHFDPLGGLANYGYLGVDFFFVLSGFVIMYSHFGEDRQTLKIKKYLSKRVWRVFPTYWFHLVLILSIRLLGAFLLKNSSLTIGLEPLNLIKNVFLLKSDKYLIGPAWSLTHELYFYLLFILFFVAGSHLYTLLMLIYCIVIVFGATLPENFITDKFIIEFFFGNLACLAVRGSAFISLRQKKMLSMVTFGFATVLIVSTLFLIIRGSVQNEDHGLRVMGIGLGTAFLFLASCTAESLGWKLPRWFAFFGGISYPLYISHGIFLSVFEKIAVKITARSGAVLVSSYFLICIFCLAYAYLFNRYFEKTLIPYIRKIKLKPEN